MNCKNCGVKVEEGAKFCASCGTRMEAALKADTKTLSAIKNHLEFLGYTVELTEAKKEGEMNMILAKHNKDTNFVAIEIQPNIINFRANFSTDKPQAPEMDKAINELGSKLDVANIFYEIEDGKAILRADAVYTGDYTKDVFARFFSLLNKDIGKIFLLESSKKAFTTS